MSHSSSDGDLPSPAPLILKVWRMSGEDYCSWVDDKKRRGGGTARITDDNRPSLTGIPWVEEWFTMTRWWHPAVTWIPISCAIIWLYGGLSALNALGLLSWPILEYALHRWVFHLHTWFPTLWGLLVPPRNVVHFLLHGYHHVYPGDRRRIATPVPLALAVIGFLYAIAVPIAGFCAHSFAQYIAGALLGFLVYDIVHTALHFPSSSVWLLPRLRWFRELKRHHDKHHYSRSDRNWGVSNTATDRVAGTKF